MNRIQVRGTCAIGRYERQSHHVGRKERHPRRNQAVFQQMDHLLLRSAQKTELIGPPPRGREESASSVPGSRLVPQGFGSHHEYRHGRSPHYAVSHAAHQPAADSRSSSRGEHDQVDTVALSEPCDLYVRAPLDDG